MRRIRTAAVTMPAMMPFEGLFDGACEEFIGVEGGGVFGIDGATCEVGTLSIPYNDKCQASKLQR